MRRMFHRMGKVDLLEASAKSIRADLELAVREVYASTAEQREAARQLQEVAASRMVGTNS
jgi:hypothetical protein